MKKLNKKVQFPALSHQMGWDRERNESYWTSYTTRMTLEQIAANIITAPEAKLVDPEEEKVLKLIIQRSIRWNRVKEIADYIISRDDRLFPPLVCAVFGSDYKFIDSNMESKENATSRKGSSVGWLELDDPSYNRDRSEENKTHFVAIDGQHRLAAIRAVTGINAHTLVNDNYESLSETQLEKIRNDYTNSPKLQNYTDLKHEELTVCFIPRPNSEDIADKSGKYRRVFTTLNRYSKSVTEPEKIVMEETDAFALTLQNLTMDHDFWKDVNAEDKLAMSTNLKYTSFEFTTVTALYNCLRIFLSTNKRIAEGVMKNNNDKDFIKKEQSDELIQQFYYESHAIWDALIENLSLTDDGKLRDYKDLRKNHQEDDLTNIEDANDFIWLWPIGLEVIAQMASNIMFHYGDSDIIENIYVKDDVEKTKKNLEKATDHLKDLFSVFSKDSGIKWELTSIPWKGLLFRYDKDAEYKSNNAAKWKMPSGSRAEEARLAVEVGSLLFSYGQFVKYPENEPEGNTTHERWLDNLLIKDEMDKPKLLSELEEITEKIRQFMHDRDLFSLKKLKQERNQI